MVAINEAYETLINPSLRQRYNLQRIAQHFTSQARPQSKTRPDPTKQTQPDEHYKQQHQRRHKARSESFNKYTNLEDIIDSKNHGKNIYSNINKENIYINKNFKF